jgi:hypothetical protein
MKQETRRTTFLKLATFSLLCLVPDGSSKSTGLLLTRDKPNPPNLLVGSLETSEAKEEKETSSPCDTVISVISRSGLEVVEVDPDFDISSSEPGISRALGSAAVAVAVAAAASDSFPPRASSSSSSDAGLSSVAMKSEISGRLSSSSSKSDQRLGMPGMLPKLVTIGVGVGVIELKWGIVKLEKEKEVGELSGESKELVKFGQVGKVKEVGEGGEDDEAKKSDKSGRLSSSSSSLYFPSRPSSNDSGIGKYLRLRRRVHWLCAISACSSEKTD